MARGKSLYNIRNKIKLGWHAMQCWRLRLKISFDDSSRPSRACMCICLLGFARVCDCVYPYEYHETTCILMHRLKRRFLNFLPVGEDVNSIHAFLSRLFSALDQRNNLQQTLETDGSCCPMQMTPIRFTN